MERSALSCNPLTLTEIGSIGIVFWCHCSSLWTFPAVLCRAREIIFNDCTTRNVLHDLHPNCSCLQRTKHQVSQYTAGDRSLSLENLQCKYRTTMTLKLIHTIAFQSNTSALVAEILFTAMILYMIFFLL